MRIGLDDGQRELRASVRALLARECPADLVRACFDDHDAWRPLWSRFLELGLTGVGDLTAGGGTVALVTVLTECGRVVCPAPVLSSVGLATAALQAAGPATADLVAELEAGAIGVLVTGVAGGRLPAAALSAHAGRVQGIAVSVADAVHAYLVVALARDDLGAELLVVLRPGPGVVIRPTASVDPARPLADLLVDAQAETVLAVPRDRVLTVPLLAQGAELVGVAEGALAMAVEHARVRTQFGKPIGSYQGVKHRLADVYVATERARSLLLSTATAADTSPDDPGLWRQAALAKAAAAEAADTATRAGVAVFGALAQTWEHDMHLLLRRSWLGGAQLGETGALYIAAARDYVEAAQG